MFQFELEAALLTLIYRKPQLVPLLQLPPRIATRGALIVPIFFTKRKFTAVRHDESINAFDSKISSVIDSMLYTMIVCMNSIKRVERL